MMEKESDEIINRELGDQKPMYRVVEGGDPEVVEKEVEELLIEGFELVGPAQHCVHGNAIYITQTLVNRGRLDYYNWVVEKYKHRE